MDNGLNVVQTTGSIVLVEFYAFIIIFMIIYGIVDIIKNRKNNKKKKR